MHKLNVILYTDNYMHERHLKTAQKLAHVLQLEKLPIVCRDSEIENALRGHKNNAVFVRDSVLLLSLHTRTLLQVHNARVIRFTQSNVCPIPAAEFFFKFGGKLLIPADVAQMLRAPS